MAGWQAPHSDDWPFVRCRLSAGRVPAARDIATSGRHAARVAFPRPLAGAVGSRRTAGVRTLRLVTAQPAEDPADPQVILRDLPQRERDEFLRQYHQAVDAAHDPAGYQQLRRLLHVWSLTAVATGQPGYYEELAAAQAGTSTTVPVTD